MLQAQRVLDRVLPPIFDLARNFSHRADLLAGLFHLPAEHQGALYELWIHDMAMERGKRIRDES